MNHENQRQRLNATKSSHFLDEEEKSGKRSFFEQKDKGTKPKLLELKDKSGDVEKHGSKLKFGTAEVPELFSLNERQRRLQHRQNRIREGLKYHTVVGKSPTGRKVRQVRKQRLIFPGEKSVGKKQYFFKETGREETTEEDYKNLLIHEKHTHFHNRMMRNAVYQTGMKLIDDENIKEDESATEWKSRGRRYYRGSRRVIDQSIHNLKLQNNPYARLKYMDGKQQLLQMKKERLLNRAKRETYKSRISSASSQYQKRKLKKEMASAVRKNEGSWFKRRRNQFLLKKKSVEQKIRMTKRVTTTLFSSLSLILILFMLLVAGFLLFLILTQGVSEYVETAVTLNDYGTLSESTAYLRKLETDLEERLQDRTEFERELEQNYGPDLYEFHYDLAATGFSSTTLMAYLSAKYGTFNLDMVQAEMDELFQEMYTLEVQVVEELREVVKTDPATGAQITEEELKKICYITLHKKELEDVIADRMSQEEKEQYSNYKLTSGGIQVYGPVMLEDWTNRISSNYGERIHPITGVRTFHNGVDVAIPTGTKLYSAVTGTVTVAQYSATAGNYVRVQSDSGWTVTFMHMDTLAVRPGDKVMQGDFLGHSGNTGRSTGPHLHLEVRDANDNPINPIFIVPQNCYRPQGGT